MSSALSPSARIYVAGHKGLVGSALVRRVQAAGYSNLLLRTHTELDLTNQTAVRRFFADERPQYVFLAAARVGGILANTSFPADFITENLLIQSNVIQEAHRNGVERLLFLGSSCIYPKFAPQPLQEDSLLTGALEPTNRAYAVAKIAGIEMCWAYNRQHGTNFLAAMPSNLYGPGDNYHPDHSHLIPGLIRRMHEAKANGDVAVIVWGTGAPRREFLYSEDAADACIFLMGLPAGRFAEMAGNKEQPPLVNIGWGADMTVREAAEMVAETVGFRGQLVFDPARPDGTPRKLLDTTHLTSLGWRPQVSLPMGLQKTYEDFCSRIHEGHPTLVA